MARYIDTDILAKIVFSKWQECDELKHIIPAIRREIMCASTTDVPDRKVGKWTEELIEDRSQIEAWQSARCSVCGKYHTTPYFYYFDNFAYCPNCGAKMDEVEK